MQQQQEHEFVRADSVAVVLIASGCPDCISTFVENAALLGNSELPLLSALLQRLTLGGAAVDPSAAVAAFLSAAAKGHWRCLQLLLDPANASPALTQQLLTATDTYGRSALMRAAEGGHLRCLQHLLEHTPPPPLVHEEGPGYGNIIYTSCCAAMGATYMGLTSEESRPAAVARHIDCSTLLLTLYPDVATERRRWNDGWSCSSVDCAFSSTVHMISTMQKQNSPELMALAPDHHRMQRSLRKFLDSCLAKGALLDSHFLWEFRDDLDVQFRSIIRGMAHRALVPGAAGQAAAAADAAFDAACNEQERATLAALPAKPVHDSPLGCLCHNLHARYRKWSKPGLTCFSLGDDAGCYSLLQQANEPGDKATWPPLPAAAKEAAGSAPCTVTCAADRACRAALALLAAPRPSDRQLDRALLALCTSVSQLDPAAEHARILSSRKCAACLVARGAFFGPQQPEKEPVAVLRSILKDMASKALANEAARDVAKGQLELA